MRNGSSGSGSRKPRLGICVGKNEPSELEVDAEVGRMLSMFWTACLFFLDLAPSSSFFGGSSTMTVDVSRVNSSGDLPDTKTVTTDVFGAGGSGSAVAVWVTIVCSIGDG